MFTIEVEERKKDEDFEFKDLKIIHQDCMGGKIEIGFVMAHLYDSSGIPRCRHLIGFYELTCARCTQKVWLVQNSEYSADIIKTATDGQKREIRGYQGILDKDEIRGATNPIRNEVKITVVCKKSTPSITEEEVKEVKEVIFTIIVSQKHQNEKFTFIDLQQEFKIIHEGCYGGEGEWLSCCDGQDAIFCTRCRKGIIVDVDLISFILTAIDGEERLLQNGMLRVIQKRRITPSLPGEPNKKEEALKKRKRNKEKNIIEVSRKKRRVFSIRDGLKIFHKNIKQAFFDSWARIREIFFDRDETGEETPKIEWSNYRVIIATILLWILLFFVGILCCFSFIILKLWSWVEIILDFERWTSKTISRSQILAEEEIEKKWLLLLERYTEIESEKNSLSSDEIMEEIKELGNNYLGEVSEIIKEHNLRNKIHSCYRRKVLRAIYYIAVQRENYKWAESFAQKYGLLVI